MRYKLIYFLSFFFIIISCTPISNQQYYAKQGVLDLSGWDINKIPMLSLKGEWKFYWKQLLTPDTIDTVQNTYDFIKVPGIWNSAPRNFPVDGYATYRLDIKFNEEYELGLKVNSIATAYKLWINGNLTAQSGNVSDSGYTSIPQLKTKYVKVSPKNNMISIIIQVSNYHADKSGLWNDFIIGDYEKIFSDRDSQIVSETLIACFLSFLGLFQIAYFSIKRNEKSVLFLGIFCILGLINIFVLPSSLVIRSSMPWAINTIIETITYVLYIPFFYLFIFFLYSGVKGKRYLQFSIIAGIILIFCAVFVPLKFYNFFLPILHIYIISGCILVISRLFFAIKDSKTTLLILIGFLVMFTAICIDILAVYYFIKSTSIHLWSILIFLAFNSIALWIRLSNSEKLTIEREKYLKEEEERIKAEKEKLKQREKNYEKMIISLEVKIIEIDKDKKENMRWELPSDFDELKPLVEKYLKNNYRITKKEFVILIYLIQGYTINEIDNQLDILHKKIALSTIKKHRENIYSKFEVHNQMQLMSKFREILKQLKKT